MRALGSLKGAAAIGGALAIYSMLGLQGQPRAPKPRRDPNSEIRNTRERAMAAFGIGALAQGTSMLLTRKLNPLIGIGAFGATAIGLAAADGNKSHDPKTQMQVNLLSATAGTIVALKVARTPALGIKSLRDFLTRQGAAGAISSMDDVVNNAKHNFPLLNTLLNNETFALTVGAATIPVAHTVIQHAINAKRNFESDHADFNLIKSFTNVSNPPRQSNGTLYSRASMSGDLSFSGSLRSHVDTSRLNQI